MPAKNIIKRFYSGTFYHIYNRGVEKRIIFHDDQDRKKFLNLFDRYLNENNDEVDQNNIRYPKFGDQIQIHSYALMDNHFHLLIKTGHPHIHIRIHENPYVVLILNILTKDMSV
jgi:putative transposase